MLKALLFCFGLLVTGLSIVFVDQEMANFFDQYKYEEIRLKARAITDIGLGEYWFGAAVVVFLFARFVMPRMVRYQRRSELITNFKNWSIYMFLGLLGSGLILRLVKWIFGRQRPHLSPNHDQLVFEFFSNNWHYQSFPSGHAQVLFASAVSISLLWPRARWLIYLVATALAYTRVMTLAHFFSDIVAGAMIGYFGTLWVHSLLKAKVASPKAFSELAKSRLNDADREVRAPAP